MYRRLIVQLAMSLISLSLAGCGLMDPNVQKGFSLGIKMGEGKALAKRGQYSKAERKYNEALAELDQIKGLETEALRTPVLADLAEVYMQQKRYQEAQSKFESAIALYETSKSHTVHKQPRLERLKADCFDQYAVLLRAMNEPDKTAQMEAKAKEISAQPSRVPASH